MIPEWIFPVALGLSLAMSVLFVVGLALFAVGQWKMLRREDDDSMQERILDEIGTLRLELGMLRDQLEEQALLTDGTGEGGGEEDGGGSEPEGATRASREGWKEGG